MSIFTHSLPVQQITSGPANHFFGYYDKSPWNIAKTVMLALEVNFFDRPPTWSDRAGICLVNLDKGKSLDRIATTSAWNWQQGCMLQWLPEKTGQQVIFNDCRGDEFVSVVFDLWFGEVRTLPMPIYALSQDGKYALSLNFKRLAITRPGYGYANGLRLEDLPLDPATDGIYWIDIQTGASRLIISIEQIAKYNPRAEMKGSIHWFNHIQINPQGTRFAFLHRWSPPGKPDQRMTRLFTANPDGSDLFLLSDHDMVSHYDWRDSTHILAWARRKDYLDLRRPRSIKHFLRGWGVDSYFLFTDHTETARVVGRGSLRTDGHCSYSPDRKWILTDTYPDPERKRTLILYNPTTGDLHDLGRFFSPPSIEEVRCDLHPRWSPDGLQICFDSFHNETRQMYTMDVSGIVS